MNKTPCIFERIEGLAIPSVTRGCEWVIVGQGQAYHKFDGTGARVLHGRVYGRSTVRGNTAPPPGWEPFDEYEGREIQEAGREHKRYGWLPGEQLAPKWFDDGVCLQAADLPDGTYELCGPGIQRNIECLPHRMLLSHKTYCYEVPRTFEGVHDWLIKRPDIEGVVFWHPDGRRAKIRGRDFGIKRLPRDSRAQR